MTRAALKPRPQTTLWPVLGRVGWSVRPIAWFDDYGKAADFIAQNIGSDKGYLFIGKPEDVA